MYVKNSAKFANPVLIAALLLSSHLGVAQQTTQGTSPAQQPARPGSLAVDPSAGPLTPTEPTPQVADDQATLPNSPQPATPATPNQQSAAQQTSRPVQNAPEEPLGAAAAGQIKTAGGGASRPAGNAIAPAKQRQYRSLLIKLGAVAAAGIAVGTVYGLTHATPSTPPHTATAATK